MDTQPNQTNTPVEAQVATPVAPVTSTPLQTPAPAKNNNTMWIIVAVVTVLLLVLCCCCGSIIASPDFQKSFNEEYQRSLDEQNNR